MREFTEKEILSVSGGDVSDHAAYNASLKSAGGILTGGMMSSSPLSAVVFLSASIANASLGIYYALNRGAIIRAARAKDTAERR